MSEPVDIHPRLASFIATRDKRIAKDRPWDSNFLANTFSELLSKGEVCVGGRATCGSYTDPTWTVFRLWNEVVVKARKLGYQIEEESIKHKNGWATKAGGFWDESVYRVARSQGASA